MRVAKDVKLSLNRMNPSQVSLLQIYNMGGKANTSDSSNKKNPRKYLNYLQLSRAMFVI